MSEPGSRRARPPEFDPSGIRGVTFDFGNTLVPVDRAALDGVVARTAAVVAERCGLGDPAAFVAVWAEERERQFREALPAFREVDIGERTIRVVARLRGMPRPATSEAWDDLAAAARVAPEEVAFTTATYSAIFVETMPPDPHAGPVLERLARTGRVLAILSNWPLAATVDRYAEVAGWLPWLSAIVVSQRVGTIKPQAGMFEHAATALGLGPASLLHVGDDWAADVVGAKEAGWRAAHLLGRPADSPLPDSLPTVEVAADLVILSLRDLADALAA